MTPLALQDFLVKEISALFEGVKLKNEAGELSNISVLSQYSPVSDTGQVVHKFPFVRVLLKLGKDPKELDPHRWAVIFVAGVYDNSVDCQGYRDAINILQKIYDHLMRKRVFDQKYEVGYPVHWLLTDDAWKLTEDRWLTDEQWKLTDESSYPYFYVGLKTVWTVGKITVADTLS
jgi:hypothetical protein